MERFAIIGLGRFGRKLATDLAEAGADVIAIDHNRDVVESVRDKVSLAVCMDSTDEDALLAQGVDKVDAAVVGIGANFEANLLTTVILKQLGVPRVISRATTPIRGQILTRVGADGIVNPEEETAERWSGRLLAPAIMERIELAEGYTLAQVAAPAGFYHKTLGDLSIRQKYKVNVVAIRRIPPASGDGKRRPAEIISVPMADTVVQPQDVLLVIGSDDAIQTLPTK